jgi:hypothetical protein
MFQKILKWIRSWFTKPAAEAVASPVIDVPSKPVYFEPDRIKPTKAYADQRQKMPHNRRRKPSKAMHNLYQL